MLHPSRWHLLNFIIILLLVFQGQEVGFDIDQAHFKVQEIGVNLELSHALVVFEVFPSVPDTVLSNLDQFDTVLEMCWCVHALTMTQCV